MRVFALGLCTSSFALLAALTAGGCAAGTTKTVGAAAFALDASETGLAHQMEAEDPDTEASEERCTYWRRQRAGVPARHVALRRWASALRDTVCRDAAARRAEERADRQRLTEHAHAEAEGEEHARLVAEREAAQEAARAADAARKEKRRADAHALAVSSLELVERDIPKLTPSTITDAQLKLFQAIISGLALTASSFEESGAPPSEAQNVRFQAAREKVGKLVPAYDRALAAARARAEKKLTEEGWVALKSRLAAPSSAKLVEAKVLLRCERGAIIAYEFDAQNRMGATLRSLGAVKINDSGGFNARLKDEEVMGMSPFDALLAAAKKADCSELK